MIEAVMLHLLVEYHKIFAGMLVFIFIPEIVHNNEVNSR